MGKFPDNQCYVSLTAGPNRSQPRGNLNTTSNNRLCTSCDNRDCLQVQFGTWAPTQLAISRGERPSEGLDDLFELMLVMRMVLEQATIVHSSHLFIRVDPLLDMVRAVSTHAQRVSTQPPGFSSGEQRTPVPSGHLPEDI